MGWAADNTLSGEQWLNRLGNCLSYSPINSGAERFSGTQDLFVFPLCHPRPGHHSQTCYLIDVPRWLLHLQVSHLHPGEGEMEEDTKGKSIGRQILTL